VVSGTAREHGLIHRIHSEYTFFLQGNLTNADTAAGRGIISAAIRSAWRSRRRPLVSCPQTPICSDEAAVVWLILILLVIWVVLVILVTAWSMWFQAFLYTEASGGLVWRGPAAASAIMAVVLVWVVLDYRTGGNVRPIWSSTSSKQTEAFKELRV